MKKIFFLLLIVAMYTVGSAQTNVTRSGDTFTVTSTESSKAEKAEDVKLGNVEIKGVKYPLYRGKRGGIYIVKDGKKVYSFPGKDQIVKQLDNAK